MRAADPRAVSRRRLLRSRNRRRGATLVTVAIALSALLGFAGVGVDFAHAYAVRTQLKTAADAAAMAGAVEMLRGSRADRRPETVALGYVPRNSLDGVAAAVSAEADVEAVRWDYNVRRVSGTYGDAYDAPEVNAVGVTAQYALPLTFSRVFGLRAVTLSETSVAAVGGVAQQDCLRPWAVPYRTVVDLLNERFPATQLRTVDDALTSEDIQRLVDAGSSATVSLLDGAGNPTASGNVGQVVTFTTALGNGNDGYRHAITGELGCADLAVGPGSWIDADAGAGSGQTAAAVEEFCRRHGGVTLGGPGNDAVRCTTSPKVKLALWDVTNGQPGNNLQYRVKYVAAFAVVGYQPATGGGGGGGAGASGNGTGGSGGNNGNGGNGGSGGGAASVCPQGGAAAQLCGYFTLLPTSGAFAGVPGMTVKAAIVE